MPFMMNIDGAKFEEHRFNTPRDMLDSVIFSDLWIFFGTTHYKNLNISITKEDISKRKKPLVFFLKSLKNKR